MRGRPLRRGEPSPAMGGGSVGIGHGIHERGGRWLSDPQPMLAVFVGHGNPMNTIERKWKPVS